MLHDSSRNRAVLFLAVSSTPQLDGASMEEQEAVCRAYCTRHHLHIINVLTVPGLSRSESDIFDLFEEYASRGIYAYHDLRKLWKARAFDWLVCYVDERLGRSTSLYSHTIENIIRSGARIASVINGITIDADNVEGFLAMGGYATSMDVKKLKKRRAMGIRARGMRGLKVSSHTPFGFKELRDERGKVVKMVPDERYRRLWDDAATLFLEGVGWHRLERDLFERFGHAAPNGKQWPTHKIRSTFYTAAFWGHTALNYRNHQRGQDVGLWVCLESEPCPDGVEMFRNTHEAIYSGELAVRVKAEMVRRRDLVGQMRPQSTAAFSGLLVCAECGYYLVVNRDAARTFSAWRCVTRYYPFMKRGACPGNNQIAERRVRVHFRRIIQDMLDNNDLGAFAGPDARRIEERKTALLQEIGQTDDRMRRLMEAVKTVDSDNPAWSLYTSEISQLGEQMKRLRIALDDSQRAIAAVDNSDQFRALAEIRAQGQDAFWQQPEYAINQSLRRLLGSYRLALEAGELRYVVEAPVRRRSKRDTPSGI